jgi:hypothetical protein
VDLGFDRYDAAAFVDGVSVAAWIEPRDVTAPQVLANVGGSATLGIKLNGESGVVFSLSGPDGRTTVSWDDLVANERRHVAGIWDGRGRLSLAVDGDIVDETRFAGPLALETGGRSWTLLKDEYLFDHGYDGTAEEVRLYDRALSTAELRSLAE